MSNFGGAFGVFVIIIVTLAQLAGNGKRNKNKNRNSNRNYDGGQPGLKEPGKKSSKLSWTKMAKKKSGKIDSEEKINAESTAPSFEVDGKSHDDVHGFDVD